MQEQNLIPVDEILSIDDLPQNFSILQQGLENIFSNIFISNIQSSINYYQKSTYYSFSVVSFGRITIEIPATNGISIVLNPDLEQENSVEFPMSIFYSLPILELIDSFDLNSFDFSYESFYALFLTTRSISPELKLRTIIDLN